MKRTLYFLVFILIAPSIALSGEIQRYDEFDQFAEQFDSVEIYPQDTSDFGTTGDGFFWQLDVGEVTIEFEGPPFYDGVFLSKSIPWTLTPDSANLNGGLGFYIAQIPPVDITVFDKEGDTFTVENFSTGSSLDDVAFLGFTSTAGITRIQISGNPDFITNMSEIALSPDELASPRIPEHSVKAIPVYTTPMLVASILALTLAAWRHLRT
jgi:hypothetical protein